MIFDAADFSFKAPAMLSRARRVLIKPSAGCPVSYPVTTSRDLLALIVKGIRRISDADILLLEGTADGSPVYPIFQTLAYDFPRVLTLDVKDCIWVEVENPLRKPLAVATFWVPNVILSSDYLITVAPLKVADGKANLAIPNLLSLLPSSKYGDGWKDLYALGINKVLADLYFTLPFDLGIIEARQKFTTGRDPTTGKVEECGKVFTGEPYQIDTEAAQTLNIKAGYLKLIEESMEGLEAEA